MLNLIIKSFLIKKLSIPLIQLRVQNYFSVKTLKLSENKVPLSMLLKLGRQNPLIPTLTDSVIRPLSFNLRLTEGRLSRKSFKASVVERKRDNTEISHVHIYYLRIISSLADFLIKGKRLRGPMFFLARWYNKRSEMFLETFWFSEAIYIFIICDRLRLIGTNRSR